MNKFTVGQLKEYLQRFDDELPVYISTEDEVAYKVDNIDESYVEDDYSNLNIKVLMLTNYRGSKITNL